MSGDHRLFAASTSCSKPPASRLERARRRERRRAEIAAGARLGGYPARRAAARRGRDPRCGDRRTQSPRVAARSGVAEPDRAARTRAAMDRRVLRGLHAPRWRRTPSTRSACRRRTSSGASRRGRSAGLPTIPAARHGCRRNRQLTSSSRAVATSKTKPRTSSRCGIHGQSRTRAIDSRMSSRHR